jgi:hypothetical protein
VGGHHSVPSLTRERERFQAEFQAPQGHIIRTLQPSPGNTGWEVQDLVKSNEGAGVPFSVFWQFAPGVRVERLSDHEFRIRTTGDAELRLEIDPKAASVQAMLSAPADPIMSGTVSPGFRQKTFAPFIKLTTGGDKPCLLRTRFLASISG